MRKNPTEMGKEKLENITKLILVTQGTHEPPYQKNKSVHSFGTLEAESQKLIWRSYR